MVGVVVVGTVVLGCGPSVGHGTGSMSGESGDGSDSTTDCVPMADAEVCDGVDNDCDEMIDEDIAPIVCGAGNCETTVVCEDGFMPACVPREPLAEACNLEDDDCDGEVDEGFGFGPLGDAIVVRTNEFDTGPCTSCSWAGGAALAPTDDGVLALWKLGLYGGSEQPTLYGRSLDGAGMPTTPVELLRDDFILDMYPMQALEPMPAMGLPLSIEHRTPGQEDVAGLLFAATDGSTALVQPIPGQSPSNVEHIVWSGERFVTVWEEDDQLRVAVLAADGSVETMVDVDPLERPGAMTLGVFPGRVGLLVSRVRNEGDLRDQWFVAMDAFGNLQAPAHAIDLEYTSWQRLVGTDEGWLNVRPNTLEGASTRQALDTNGDPIDAATPFADARTLDDSGHSDTFVPRPGLGEMITAWWSGSGSGVMHVEFLDSRGNVLRGWSGPLPPDPGQEIGGLGHPHIQFVGDRVLVIWDGSSEDAQPNPVFVREFGCVP
jgi:hypothetical protein